MMELPRSEFDTTYTRPNATDIVNSASGEVIFVLITAGEEESATFHLLDGSFSNSSPLIAPLRAPAGETKIFNFPSGSLTFYDGLYGILTDKHAQATVKGFID